MRRAIIGASVAAAVCGSLTLPGAAAEGTGITVSTPSSRTVYNHGRAAVTATTRVVGQRTVSAKSIAAYQGARRVASGNTVRLPAGSYALKVRVTYRPYTWVTRTRTVTVHRESDFPDGTRCTVDEVAYDDYITASTCTNDGRPGQVVHDTYTSTDTPPPYTVGQVVISDLVEFPAYDRVEQQSYQDKQYGAARVFTTGLRRLTVRNGGNRAEFANSESRTTGYFHPRGHWRAHYSYDCSNFGSPGNWIVVLQRRGGIFSDRYLDNVIRRSGEGNYRFTTGGTFRWNVITECDWSITAYWR